MGEIRDIFIASRRFSALEGKPLPLAELEHLPVICLEKNTSTRRYVDAFFAGCGARLTPEFELATSDLIVQFAERSLGVGCVVEAFARRAIAEGTVFRIPTEPDIPPRQICVARSPASGLQSRCRIAGADIRIKILHMNYKERFILLISEKPVY